MSAAEWVLVDVSGDTNRHPADIQSALQALLAGGWGVADAADGYVLLQKGSGAATLPDAFYDFARAGSAGPQHRLDVTFGSAGSTEAVVRLLGYDLIDDPKWRLTRFRFYWQALAPLPQDTTILLEVLAPDGVLVDDTTQRPMPALLWYPPALWRPGETVVTEKPGWYLPATWAPVLTVTAQGAGLTPDLAGGNATALAGRDGAAAPTAVEDGGQAVSTMDGRLRLPAWTRLDGRLAPWRAPAASGVDGAQFQAEGWQARLAAYSVPVASAPGGPLPVALRWEASGSGSGQDYTVFLHLRNAAGQTVANGDATPAWFTVRPTSAWAGSDAAPFVTWDAHSLALPGGLPSGRYSLVAGFYYWQTGRRVPLLGPDGNGRGEEYVLGYVDVDAGARFRPTWPA